MIPGKKPQFVTEDITVFAETNFRDQKRRFGIKTDDRRRHMYLIGKTGMGKSTVIENMVVDDIRNNRGVAIVDPHGDLVEKIIRFIPNERVNDVIYFNPADTANPIAFNILENVDPEYKHLIAYGLVGVFKKIWADSWGPRMEYILTNTILALLEYPGSTLLGIMRMLVDKKYRKKVVSKITDPVVRTFWTDEYANYSEKFRTEAIAPIQNKVGQFLASSIIRNIVGQSKSTIEMREAIDNGKIILMNLSKGRIGEENSALLGAMMITKIQLAAMSRVDIPEEKRRDFFLYVDEFQNFATESFAGILSEARKYRLNLVMAHQYIEQLSDEVKAAVFGNVGTIICFRIGASDAEELEKEFEPQFTAQHLVNIPKYNFYAKLMIDGIASDPFSALGLPPFNDFEENADKVIKVSRERYARPKKVVEDRILRWSGVEIPEAAKKEKSIPAPEQPAAEPEPELVPAPVPVPVPTPVPVPEPQSSRPQVSFDPMPEIEPEQPKTEKNQEQKPIFKAPSFVQAQPQSKPEPQPKLEPESQPAAKTEVQKQKPIEDTDKISKKRRRKKKKKKKSFAPAITPDALPRNAQAIPHQEKKDAPAISLKQISNKTVAFGGSGTPNLIKKNNQKQELSQKSKPVQPAQTSAQKSDDSADNKISLNDLF